MGVPAVPGVGPRVGRVARPDRVDPAGAESAPSWLQMSARLEGPHPLR